MVRWKTLIFGKYNITEIKRAVKEPKWQEFRKGLKGISLEQKFRELKKWLRRNRNSKRAKIQVTNYVNALKRAGLI